MSKQQLIEAIRQHNRSASSEFLVEFSQEALNDYLTHLRYKQRPRASASWIRRGDSAAVVTRLH
jgi:hypothetical protein